MNGRLTVEVKVKPVANADGFRFQSRVGTGKDMTQTRPVSA